MSLSFPFFCKSPKRLEIGCQSGTSSLASGPRSQPLEISSIVFSQTWLSTSLSPEPCRSFSTLFLILFELQESSSTVERAGTNFTGKFPVKATSPTRLAPYLSSSTTDKSGKIVSTSISSKSKNALGCNGLGHHRVHRPLQCCFSWHQLFCSSCPLGKELCAPQCDFMIAAAQIEVYSVYKWPRHCFLNRKRVPGLQSFAHKFLLTLTNVQTIATPPRKEKLNKQAGRRPHRNAIECTAFARPTSTAACRHPPA